MIRDEPLHLINGYRLVHISSRALVLTAVIADPSADCRERIFLLDERQRVPISSLCRQPQISLHRDMRRTGGLAGRGSGLHHVLPVLTVIRVPVLFRPYTVPHLPVLRRNNGLGGTQLLAQLQRIARTIFHALAAGYALRLVDLCHVVGADHVPCAVHQTDPQPKAGTGAAVADGRALPGLLDIRHVMHQPVVLCPFQDLIHLIPGDFPRPSGPDVMLRALSHLDAHILLQMPAAVVQGTPGRPAGARGYGKLVVFVDVIAQLVIIVRLGNILDRAFHRDDTHQPIAVWHHGRHVGHPDPGVFLECPPHLRVGL